MDVLQFTTNRLFGSMYSTSQIIGFMANDPYISAMDVRKIWEFLETRRGEDLQARCKQAIFDQYPQLREIDVSQVTGLENFLQFKEEMKRRFGDKLNVAQIHPSTSRIVESDYDFWRRIESISSPNSLRTPHCIFKENDVPDLYSLLDVEWDATEGQIKASYRKLAKLYHPDLNQAGDEAIKEEFMRITGAYEVLGDAEKRAVYDSCR